MRRSVTLIAALIACIAANAQDKFSAHRGLQEYAPENTIPAFVAAGQKGCWAIETDLRLTKDGHIVCIHDSSLDRTFEATGSVSDYTLDELRKFRSKTGQNKKIGKNYNYDAFSDEEMRIPTFDEYLNICSKYGCVAFIELKEDGGLIRKMQRAIRKHGMSGRVVISSSHLDLLESYRKIGKEPVHLIFGKTDQIRTMQAMGNASIAFNYPVLWQPIEAEFEGRRITSVSQLSDLCHSLGLKVCYRAIDDLATMQKASSVGVDYYNSNLLWSPEGEHLCSNGTDYTIEKWMTKKGYEQSLQGMSIMDDLIFVLENKGTCLVYDFKERSGMPLARFPLGSYDKDNHANCCNFGVETAPGGTYPLLYVTNGKPGVPGEYVCQVESISRDGNNFSSKVVQRIKLDTEGFAQSGLKTIWGCPSWLIDRERRNIWVFSAVLRTMPKVMGTDMSRNTYVATKFRLPSLSEGGTVEFTSADVLDQVCFDFDAFGTQGGCVVDGKIYYSYGFGKVGTLTPSKIRVYDTETGRISTALDLEGVVGEEPEDIAIYDGYLYLNVNAPGIYRICLNQ